MNVQTEMEPSGKDTRVLSEYSVEDLIAELKTRCTAIVVTMAVDDEESNEEMTLMRRMGGRIHCIGLMRDAEATMIHEGLED